MGGTKSKLRFNFEYVKTSSYVGTKSGTIKMTNLNPDSVKNKHVLVLEDIYDSGKSMKHLLDHLNELGPKTLKVAVMLHKRNHGNLVYKWKADFTGYFLISIIHLGL